jgi:hypothetical protein
MIWFQQWQIYRYNDSLIAKSVQIKRDKAAQIVVNKLGPSEYENIVKKLKGKDQYFSLILDETTSREYIKKFSGACSTLG